MNVKLGERKGAAFGADALLDFSVEVALEGERLNAKELQTLLDSTGELVWLRGRWIEIDREKLGEALRHWKQVEQDAKHGGVSDRGSGRCAALSSTQTRRGDLRRGEYDTRAVPRRFGIPRRPSRLNGRRSATRQCQRSTTPIGACDDFNLYLSL